MNVRFLAFLAGAGAAILVPLAAGALPLVGAEHSAHARTTLIDDDGDEDEGDGQSRRVAGRAECGEDDAVATGCASGNRVTPQDASPPGNGLFTPGAKPQVQIN